MWAWIHIAPVALLSITWFRVLRAGYSDEDPEIAWIPLIVASASGAYLALAIAFHEILGPAYSSLRCSLIHLNLAAVFVVALVICFWKSAAKWRLLAASLSLALQWFVIDAMNHVV